MDENDDEEEEEEEEKTGWVRRDFKFGASNNIVSVPLKKNPNFFFFFFFFKKIQQNISLLLYVKKRISRTREKKKERRTENTITTTTTYNKSKLMTWNLCLELEWWKKLESKTYLNVSIGTDLSIVRRPSSLHQVSPSDVWLSVWETDVHYNHYRVYHLMAWTESFRLGRLLPSLVVVVPFS